jgi:hypothetical protein
MAEVSRALKSVGAKPLDVRTPSMAKAPRYASRSRKAAPSSSVRRRWSAVPVRSGTQPAHRNEPRSGRGRAMISMGGKQATEVGRTRPCSRIGSPSSSGMRRTRWLEGARAMGWSRHHRTPSPPAATVSPEEAAEHTTPPPRSSWEASTARSVPASATNAGTRRAPRTSQSVSTTVLSSSIRQAAGRAPIGRRDPALTGSRGSGIRSQARRSGSKASSARVSQPGWSRPAMIECCHASCPVAPSSVGAEHS